MKKIILLAISLLVSSSMALAHGDEHHMGEHNPCSMQPMEGHHQMKAMKGNPCAMKSMASMKKGTFLKKEVIDGYEVSFHVMKAPEGMEEGGTHHLMVKVEKNNTIIVLKAINSKVTHPNDNSESKMMMKMGDWYMAGYNLDHSGNHKIMILFKTEDGLKHFGGITYPNK